MTQSHFVLLSGQVEEDLKEKLVGRGTAFVFLGRKERALEDFDKVCLLSFSFLTQIVRCLIVEPDCSQCDCLHTAPFHLCEHRG